MGIGEMNDIYNTIDCNCKNLEKSSIFINRGMNLKIVVQS